MRLHFKEAVIAALVLLSPIGARAQGADNVSQSETLDQLSFLEGSWDLTTYFYNGDGTLDRQSTATMTGSVVLGGLGFVQEGKFPYEGNSIGLFAAMTLYTVKPNSDVLAAISNNSLGNRKMIDQVNSVDGLVFETRGELFGGRPGVVRGRYINITDDSFEYEQDYCPEDGRSCRVRAFAYKATRKS